MKSPLSTQSIQQGVGLLEVLIALLLLAIGVLGFVALQTNSMQATGEALERTQSLVLMRDLAEKVRVNPTAIDQYEKSINAVRDADDPNSLESPTKDCSTQKCEPNDLAIYDTYLITKQMNQYGFKLGIDKCPGTGGNNTKTEEDKKRATYSYCLITAWGNSTPTYGTNANKDCLDENGSYYRDATCMFMELT